MTKEAKTEDRTELLEKRIETLENNLNQLTEAIRKSAHVMGWPRDLLEKHGIKAFDKTTESLRN